MSTSRDDQLDSIISENRESSDDVFFVVVKSDRFGTNVLLLQIKHICDCCFEE